MLRSARRPVRSTLGPHVPWHRYFRSMNAPSCQSQPSGSRYLVDWIAERPSGGLVTDLETADGVTIVRFDNAPVNALDLDLLGVIIASMHSAAGPVVITGAGRAFSAGVDLRALADGGTDYAGRFVAALSEAFLAIYDHPGPVVAAINGHAIRQRFNEAPGVV